MIFVTVGSTSFDELIKKVDELKASGFIKDYVIAQVGYGKYVPKYIDKWFRFSRDLKRYIAQADLIITHGGAGTLYEILHLGKKAIAIMNPHAINNRELPEELHKRQMIILCEGVSSLERCLREAMSREFKRYTPAKCKIHEVIIKYLEALE